MLCFAGGIKRAEGSQPPYYPPYPPPQQHNHSWTAGAPIPKPIVILFRPGTTYTATHLRCYEIAWLADVASATDWDRCIAPGCPFPNGWAADLKVRVRWSDNGAGGQFGTLDSNGNFVPLDPVFHAQQITHYRAPWNKPGIVHITLEVNDVGIYFNDEPSVVNDSDNGNVTVWEFWINDGAYGWVPSLDSELTFVAWIEPTVDHRGQSMASIIIFVLSASAEPGYCMNATRVNGQWDDTIGPDLKFHPDQPDPRVFRWGETIAGTWVATTDAIVKVVCLDYGAHSGSLTAVTTISGEEAIARLNRNNQWVMNYDYAPIPWDINCNFISDFSSYDRYIPFEDKDVSPVGDGTVGDNFTA
ncbi:MAG: hypothetical protein NZ805_00005, partial [Armatimonadetes bacterium]|nr:hypothetical protein [Armatimonadota bacterium]